MTTIEIDEEFFLPKFRHLLDDTGIDIDFSYGGRDGGKSYDEAERLVLKCLSEEYFRYVLCRKTANTIKDSQWQMIKDVVAEWGLQDKFVFNVSPLEIKCVNGNKFLCRGLDEPAKLKSITNPSGAWVEEGNQIDEEDFIVLLTTLRSNKGRIKLDFTFNPEANTPIFEDFWLYKNFFSHTTEKSFTNTKNYEINGKQFPLVYRATHSTYHDNPYVTPQRIAMHESLKETNYYWYQVFTLGEWGNKINESPWAYAFSRAKHVRKGLWLQYCNDRSLPLLLSFDFNRNPMCCSVIQHDRQKKEMRFIETIKIPNTGVDEVCNRILTSYPNFLYIVTGDYSGHNQQSYFKEQITNFLVIKNKLRISDGQIKTKTHPKLAQNRTLVNLALQHYKILMDEDKARALIFDFENCTSNADGTILKENREDPAQQADALDTARYAINLELADFEKLYLPK